MSLPDLLPIAVSLEEFTDIGFWTSVGVLAGTYTIFALGLQLNVGYTGVVNFGQVGFAALGAYTMAILVTDTGMSFWLAMPIAIVVTILFGLVIGMPALRLRADYFAITTIAAAEAIRLRRRTRATSPAATRVCSGSRTTGTPSRSGSRSGSSGWAGATPSHCSRS